MNSVGKVPVYIIIVVDGEQRYNTDGSFYNTINIAIDKSKDKLKELFVHNGEIGKCYICKTVAIVKAKELDFNVYNIKDERSVN